MILRWGVVLTLLWALVACAQPVRQPQAQEAGNHAIDADAIRTVRTAWIGRMALQLERIEGSSPSPHSFSAAFELHGSPVRGQLKLFSPLGNTLAQIDWEPEQAQLETANGIQQSSSLETLLQQATGAQIPVAALFDWLSGVPTASEGWQADLSAITQGKIVAVRQTPEPQAALRIVLEP